MNARSELVRRVQAARLAPPLTDASAEAIAELDVALGAAEAFEDLPGKWQAAVLAAESGAPQPDACHRCH